MTIGWSDERRQSLPRDHPRIVWPYFGHLGPDHLSHFSALSVLYVYTSFLHVYINSDPTLGHLRPDHLSHLLHCSTHISLSCVYINCAPESPVRPDHLSHLTSTLLCTVLCCALCTYKRLFNACTRPTHPPTPTHAFSSQTAFVLHLGRFPNRTQQCNLATDTDHDFLL